jgi:hypothetical protein
MTYKHRVQQAIPNAILICDTTFHGTHWANIHRYAIIDFYEKYNEKQLNIKYDELMNLISSHDENKKINFLSAWEKTEYQAWKTTWKVLNEDFIKKLEY